MRFARPRQDSELAYRAKIEDPEFINESEFTRATPMKALEDLHKEAEAYRKKMGSWIVAGLETHMFWPTKLQVVEFNERRFLLMPAEKDRLPAIALLASDYGLTSAQARSEIMRFASALSWRERKKIDIVIWGGGNRPYRLGVSRTNAIPNLFPQIISQLCRTNGLRQHWRSIEKASHSRILSTRS